MDGEETHKIQRSSLGVFARLGDFYDCRKDRFTGGTIFNTPIQNLPVTSIPLDKHVSEDKKILRNDSYTEQFNELNIESDLQLSFVLKLASFGGHFCYVNSQNASKRNIKYSVLNKITTYNQSFNIYDDQLLPFFSRAALQTTGCTHFVSGITWGGNVQMTMEYRSKNKNKLRAVSGYLSGKLSEKLKKVNIEVEGIAGGSISEEDFTEEQNIEIHILGDIHTDGNLPVNFQTGMDLFNGACEKIKTLNNGKGNPVRYELRPVKVLRSYLNMLEPERIFVSLNNFYCESIVRVFDDMQHASQIVNDFSDDVNEFKYCLQRAELDKVDNLKHDISKQVDTFRQIAADIILAIREGTASVSTLEELANAYWDEYKTGAKFTEIISQMHKLNGKIAFANEIKDKGNYITTNEALEGFITGNSNRELFILYFNTESKTSPEWLETRRLFFNEMMKPTNRIFLVVDGDFPAFQTNQLQIQVMLDGEVTVENLLEYLKPLRDLCLVSCTENVQRGIAEPETENFSIFCAGRKCQNIDHFWFCTKCRKNIRCGLDSYFYCDCGRGKNSTYEFKCNDRKHGSSFEMHEKKELNAHLNRFRKAFKPNKKTLNFLLLGESGSGKSSWINFLANYLCYRDLQIAVKNELISVVSTVFYSPKLGRKLSSGRSGKELHCENKSNTAGVNIHDIHSRSRHLRFIDTEGFIQGFIGAENWDFIIHELRDNMSRLGIEDIHCVCLFLNSSTEFTETLKFCLQEILTCLSSVENIAFCFTHVQQSSDCKQYQTALERFLTKCISKDMKVSEKNLFYFNSEAYNYLLIRHDLEIYNRADEFFPNFGSSWKKSGAEIDRLLTVIDGVHSQNVHIIFNLYSCKQILMYCLWKKDPLNTTLTNYIAERAINVYNSAKNDYVIAGLVQGALNFCGLGAHDGLFSFAKKNPKVREMYEQLMKSCVPYAKGQSISEADLKAVFNGMLELEETSERLKSLIIKTEIQETKNYFNVYYVFQSEDN